MSSRLSKIHSVHTYVMLRTVYFGWICTLDSLIWTELYSASFVVVEKIQKRKKKILHALKNFIPLGHLNNKIFILYHFMHNWKMPNYFAYSVNELLQYIGMVLFLKFFKIFLTRYDAKLCFKRPLQNCPQDVSSEKIFSPLFCICIGRTSSFIENIFRNPQIHSHSRFLYVVKTYGSAFWRTKSFVTFKALFATIFILR